MSDFSARPNRVGRQHGAGEPPLAGEPRPAGDPSAATWLEQEVTETGSVVAALLPTRFGAYARILHPAESPEGEPVRWGAVAGWAGGSLHSGVQFKALAALRADTPDDPAPWDEPPTRGDLPAPLLRALCDALARHTTRAGDCFFCVWEGWAWIQGPPATALLQAGTDAPPAGVSSGEPAPSRDLLDAPRVHLPWRDHLLLEGPIEAATQLGDRGPDHFFPQSPNVFWPADQAWCVATDIELDSTYVGGSAELVADLLRHPELETVRADVGDALGEDSDHVNGR